MRAAGCRTVPGTNRFNGAHYGGRRGVVARAAGECCIRGHWLPHSVCMLRTTSRGDRGRGRASAAGGTRGARPRSSTRIVAARATPRAAGVKHACKVSIDLSPSEAAVGERLCQLVADAARGAIARKGSFVVAVPGGSVLKMLSSLKAADGVDWSKGAAPAGRCARVRPATARVLPPASRGLPHLPADMPGCPCLRRPRPPRPPRPPVHLWYVNHKVLSHTDAGSTHKKARERRQPRAGRGGARRRAARGQKPRCYILTPAGAAAPRTNTY
jgi:hypothetical protein